MARWELGAEPAELGRAASLGRSGEGDLRGRSATPGQGSAAWSIGLEGSVSRAAGAAALDIGVQPAGRRCGHGERGTAGREGQVSGGRPGGILDEMHAGPGCVWR